MKMSVILGKKQIVLASLVTILGIAVYLNYVFAGGNGAELLSAANEETSSVSDAADYGQAQLTSASVETEDDYFTTARLERRKARDEAIETLAQTLGAEDMSDDEKEMATEKALRVSAQIESENKIETLIKAKGFTECLAYVDDSSVRVIVQTAGLTAETANQIKNIIVEETGLAAECITVGEIGGEEETAEPEEN
jgi:stage III sporulation protein AH